MIIYGAVAASSQSVSRPVRNMSIPSIHAAFKEQRIDFFPPILLSYYYYKDVPLDDFLPLYVRKGHPIFADSGAFSAMTQGESIDLHEYMNWLHRYRHWFTDYAVLDVIRDPGATYANQLTMEHNNLRPIPAFHTSEPFDYLERYVMDYPYVALGGMAGTSKTWRGLVAWLIRSFKLARSHNVRVHGFACTVRRLLLMFPWYSVDSSTWNEPFRFGRIEVFDPRTRNFARLNVNKLEDFRNHHDLLKLYGLDWRDFDKHSPTRYASALCCLSVLAIDAQERYLTGYWQNSPHPPPTSMRTLGGAPQPPDDDHPTSMRTLETPA